MSVPTLPFAPPPVLASSFTFATAGRLRFGRGCITEAPDICRAYGRRVLLVRSRSVAAADVLMPALRKQGEVLSLAVSGEPDLPGVIASLEQARAFAPDVILAIGGGSVIDHAKALAALLPAPHGPLRYLEVVGEGKALDVAPLPLVAAPSTAGTGSEATRNAVLQIPDAARKVSLRDPRLYPAVAIVDPTLCESCSPGVTLASGLDAITQVIEPFVCISPNPVTDALCRDAISRGLSALKSLMTKPTSAAWDDMALTSLLGGVALSNAGLGAVHGLAGVIGGRTGASHGAICGALLPAVLKANLAACDPAGPFHARLDWVISQISRSYGSLDDFAAWTRDHGLAGLYAQGVTSAMHDEIALGAAHASSMRANPAALAPSALARIMEVAA